jgi:ribosomal peptide maturation radical SAM protein 1
MDVRNSKRTLKDIKESILSVVRGGEILLIFPPFGSIDDVALGPHVLHSLGEEKGYKIDILYLNMLLASIIGLERYRKIYDAPMYWMLGERLFARGAYDLPPLGRNAESCADEAAAITGRADAGKLFYHTRDSFDLDTYLDIEETCNLFIDQVIPVITSLHYKIVGSSTFVAGLTNSSIALLAGIKKQSPQTVTIIGGSNCEGFKAEGIISLSKDIDYIFQGESDTIFLDFLQAYYAGELPSRKILTGTPLSDPDTLPFPHYEICLDQAAFFLGESAAKKIRICYETDRGCRWAQKSRCRFCGTHHRTHQPKSIAKVVTDLKRFNRGYPGRTLFMTDDMMPIAYHRELLPLISQKKEFPALAYQLKADLDFFGLLNLKQAKVNAVFPGIESFSTNLLKLMNKGISGSQALLFLRNASCTGIFCDWFTLWGIPGDRISDYKEILRILPLIRHLQPPRLLMPLLLLPFSPYFQEPREYNIQNLRPWQVFYMVYPESACIGKLATYYTADFSCESYRQPGIIEAIAGEINLWKTGWKDFSLVMNRMMGKYIVYDNRGLCDKEKIHAFDFQQAKEVMTAGTYENSDARKYALAEKLGLVLDSRYVPLVLAEPELLLEFEK